MNQTRSHGRCDQKVNSYRRIWMAGARYAVLSKPLKLQFWQHYTLIMPSNTHQQTISSYTQAFCTVCGEGWCIKKAIHPTLNSHAFFFHWLCRKLRANSQDEMTKVWQNRIVPLMFSSKAWSRAWWNQWMFSCLIARALNQIPEPISLGTAFAVITTNAMSDSNFYCSHTCTSLWIQLLHVPSFNSSNTHALLSGRAWAAAFCLFTLELLSVPFPPTQLSLLLFVLTQP